MGSGWFDLSEPVSSQSDYAGPLPPTRLEVLFGPPERPQVTAISTTTHSGTHVDAPSHFIPGGDTIDRIALERFHGIACVKGVEVGELGEITDRVLRAALPQLAPGEMLFVATGWDRLRGTPSYGRHPHLTLSAAQWIIEQEVPAIGVDFVTPEVAIEARPEGYVREIHTMLLSAGILIMEQLRLSTVAGRTVEVFAFPLAIAGGDGSPVRVVARDLVAGR
jgi:kynurenine formamidase